MSALRPMHRDDALAVHQLAARTFAELEERLHEPPSPPSAPEPARGRCAPTRADALLRADSRLLVAEDRGYAVVGRAGVRLLAAFDEQAAADVLRGALASVPSGDEISVEWLTARQRWAIGPVLDAGLALSANGAVFVRGDVGPFRPYLPSGAYL